MRLGADPEALEGAARELRAVARRLEHTASRIGSAIGRADWTGADADDFRDGWARRHRPALVDLAARCDGAARALRRHADEQRRAAAAGGPTGSGGVRTAPPSRLEPLPRVVDVYRAGVEGGVGPAAGALGGTLTIEHLSGDRVRVSHTERVGAGAGGGAGRSAALIRDGSPVAARGWSAGGSLRLDGTVTRTWTLDEDAVPALLAGIAVGATPMGLVTRTAAGALDAVDGAASLVGVDLPLERVPALDAVPDPDRVEHLAGVALSGSVAGGMSRASALGSSAATLALGTSSGPDGRRWIAEWTDTSSGTMSTALGRALGLDRDVPADAGLAVRVEVPEADPAGAGGIGPGGVGAGGAGAAEPAGGLVTVTATVDDRLVVVRAALDAPTAGALRDALGDAATAAARGDGTGAAAALAGLDVDPSAVTVDVSTATIDDSRWSLPVSAGAVTATPSAGHLRITRDRS